MNYILIMTALVLIFSPISMAWIDNHYLLSQYDIEMMQNEKKEGPVLSSPLNEEVQWQSFNEWQCYATQHANFSCDEIKYKHWKRVPLLTVENGNQRIEFAVSPEKDWNCQQTIGEWKFLLDNKADFCVYGAYLQDIEHLNGEFSQYWYINRIKAGERYWVENLKPLSTISD